MQGTVTMPADPQLSGLQAAAERGDARACTALGARLLGVARSRQAAETALAWIEKAAGAGDAEGLNVLAGCAAAGYLGAPDWRRAMTLLGAAAAAGSTEAQGQLLALSGAARPPGDWTAMAATIDLAPWLTPADRQPVWETPRIRAARAFAPPAVCDWLRRRAEGRMRPAMMYDGASRQEQLDPHRTCSDFEFDFAGADVVLMLVRARIAATTKLPTVAMEPPRVFHYALGEEIKPHYDRCGDAVSGYSQSGYLGDRIVTFLLYLNDGYEGGELDFPKTGFRMKGRKGDALYFAHVDADNRPDPLSLHAGLPITRGEKWVLSQWIHDRPFGVPEARSPEA